MGLALEPSFSHSTIVGSELNPVHSLFSIGSYTIKPLGGTKTREMTSIVQKKKKQEHKGVGNEHLM